MSSAYARDRRRAAAAVSVTARVLEDDAHNDSDVIMCVYILYDIYIVLFVRFIYNTGWGRKHGRPQTFFLGGGAKVT